MAGDGVPNQGPFAHWQGGTGAPVGYKFRYHDQQVTGNAWPESPEMTPGAYATLRSAALNTQQAFNVALAVSVWAPFFALYPGIDKALARLGVCRTE